MGEFVKNKYGELIELAPCKCRVCGLGYIEDEFSVCQVCGWEDDDVQNLDPDYPGGANDMSLNQHKKFWEDSKEDILKNHPNDLFYVAEKAGEYYKTHFEQINLAYHRAQDPNYDIRTRQIEENKRKRELEELQKKKEKVTDKEESDYGKRTSKIFKLEDF